MAVDLCVLRSMQLHYSGQCANYVFARHGPRTPLCRRAMRDGRIREDGRHLSKRLCQRRLHCTALVASSLLSVTLLLVLEDHMSLPLSDKCTAGQYALTDAPTTPNASKVRPAR